MRYKNYYFPFIFNQEMTTDVKQTEDKDINLNSGNIYIYPENLSHALALILQAISAENEDRIFYTYLSEIAPAEEETQIITGIIDNEISHFHMFYQIYQDITGKRAAPPKTEEFTAPDTYCEGLKKAIMGEQHAVQNYRQILFAMQPRIHLNMLTEIITDEIRHGSLFNYLYAKNRCNV